jgi:hypothetical protein
MSQQVPVRAAKPTAIDPPRSLDARFTRAEFVRMADVGAFDGMKIELVAGELQRRSPAQRDHGVRQMGLGLRLGGILPWDRLAGEISIDLGDDTVVACDLAVFHQQTSGEPIVPASDLLLVIEISETTRERDTTVKRVAYARAGIPHYWVVDGRRGVTHIYGDPIDGDYADVSTVRFGAPIDVPGTGRAIILD